MLYDALDTIDTTKVVSYVKSLQQEDGSFFGDMWGMSIHGSLHWQDKQKVNEQHRDATSQAGSCCKMTSLINKHLNVIKVPERSLKTPVSPFHPILITKLTLNEPANL